MPNSKSYEIDLCSGPILPRLLIFTLPIMASGLLQLLFNAADVVVVGKFAGDIALAAVGSNTALIHLQLNLFIGLSIGVNVLAARYYGAKDLETLSRTVQTAIAVAVLCGILLIAVGCIGARQFLIWMSVPDTVLGPAALYLRIYFAGMIATMVYNFGAALLRAVGDTRRPLYYLAVAGVLNVCLNLFFVIVCRMSVAGVALATVIGQCLSASLVLWCLIREKGAVHLDIGSMKPDKDIILSILRIGLPAGLQTVLFSVANVIIQASINSFGETVMAGNAAAANLEAFVYLGMNSFAQAVLSFAGQNAGAGRKDRLLPVFLWSELCVIITGMILGWLIVAFSVPLIGLYTDSEAVIAAGFRRTHIVALSYFLCGIMDVQVGFLRGLRYTIMPTIISIFGICALRMILIFTLFRLPEFHSVTWLYATYPLSWLSTDITYIIVFFIIRRSFLPEKETVPL